MKIFTGGFAAVGLAFSLSACGGGGDSSTPPVVVPPTPTPVSRTLTFDTNGSTGSAPAAASAIAGSLVQLPNPSLTVTGYTFSGWNTQADGRGTSYAAAATISMPNADTTLYAQFKAPPIKITQQGGDGESRLLVEWADGSQQDIVYTSQIVGWGNSYDFNPVVGGMAILLTGGSRYLHTNYPDDYLPANQPVMTITADGTTVLAATTFRLSDRTGALAAAGSTLLADEIRVRVSGRLVDTEADTDVELVIRADAPRLAGTRSKITYSRSTNVASLYHQLVHANPNRMPGPINMIAGKDGAIVEAAALPTDLTGGMFYTSGSSYYVGFVAPRAGAKDFISFRDSYSDGSNYFAAYKTLYENVTMSAGAVTESRGVASFGFSIDEARKLLGWSLNLTRGAAPTTGTVPYTDRGALRLVTDAY